MSDARHLIGGTVNRGSQVSSFTESQLRSDIRPYALNRETVRGGGLPWGEGQPFLFFFGRTVHLCQLSRYESLFLSDSAHRLNINLISIAVIERSALQEGLVAIHLLLKQPGNRIDSLVLKPMVVGNRHYH
jgi:hypothetical protein